MKRYLFILLLIVISHPASRAQETEKKRDWTAWNTIYMSGGFRDITVQISFNLSTCYTSGDLKGSLKGYSFWRIWVWKARAGGAILDFDFDYATCDGKIKTQHVFVSLSQAGVQEGPGAYFFGSAVIHEGYDPVLHDPIGEKADRLKNNLDSLQHIFAVNMNNAMNKCATIKNATTKEEYHSALVKLKIQFENQYAMGYKDYVQMEGNLLQHEMDDLNDTNSAVTSNIALMDAIVSKEDQVVTVQKDIDSNPQNVNGPGGASSYNSNTANGRANGNGAAGGSSNSVKKTPTVISFPRVTTVSNNVNVQNAINNINNAQGATDAIAQTAYLNQADLTLMYEQTHGNNTPQVQQLRQQIARLQQQYNQQNAAALQNSINNAFGGSTNNNTGLQGAINDIMDKNKGWENGNAQQKTEIKQSMNDFFNNVNFDKPDTAKRDTTTKKPIKP